MDKIHMDKVRKLNCKLSVEANCQIENFLGLDLDQCNDKIIAKPLQKYKQRTSFTGSIHLRFGLDGYSLGLDRVNLGLGNGEWRAWIIKNKL